MCEPLLDVSITVSYPNKPGALQDVNIALHRGEIVGLVGQSGSGKSTLALSVLRLLNARRAQTEGYVKFGGQDLLACSAGELRRIRGKHIALALQSAAAALNPALTIRTQLNEAWRAHNVIDLDNAAVRKLLERVHLPGEADFVNRYTGQISVGQAQRVILAMALMHDPAVLIADEPTSALDVITQAQVLLLFRSLRTSDSGILYISHDLLSVASLCDRVYILHEGRVVEAGATAEVFCFPKHSYTGALIEALPEVDLQRLFGTQRGDMRTAANLTARV